MNKGTSTLFPDERTSFFAVISDTSYSYLIPFMIKNSYDIIFFEISFDPGYAYRQ